MVWAVVEPNPVIRQKRDSARAPTVEIGLLVVGSRTEFETYRTNPMLPDDRSKPNITPVLSTSGTSGARRPNAAHAWTLDEVNHLIFLRELSVAGTLGRNDDHGSDRGT